MISLRNFVSFKEMKVFEGHFYNPTKGNLSFSETVREITDYLSEKPEKFYDIVVGCDSSSGECPYFPVAIVVLRVGHGGRFFLKKVSYKNRRFYNLKQRILEEVFISCQMALHLREEIEKKFKGKNFNWQFRYIHADIGENGVTKDMIREVVNLIRGNGFEAKIKPESFAASTIADRYA